MSLTSIAATLQMLAAATSPDMLADIDTTPLVRRRVEKDWRKAEVSYREREDTGRAS